MAKRLREQLIDRLARQPVTFQPLTRVIEVGDGTDPSLNVAARRLLTNRMDGIVVGPTALADALAQQKPVQGRLELGEITRPRLGRTRTEPVLVIIGED